MSNLMLSILIPARSEEFLARTIEDILKNREADTEVIAVLDGKWADPPIAQHPRVNVIYVPEAIGQRAATNLGAKLSRAKYIMKCDAHCSFDKGFDRKMIKEMRDYWTMVPTMRNLWAFDWKCDCGWTKYQGPTPDKCEKCGSINVKRDMKWIGKERPQSNSFRFDAVPHFQYFNEYCKRSEYKKSLKKFGLTETMSLQGSCFMMTREKYLEFALGRDELGSWGNEGIEIACKTWLSGGRVIVNHKTWYAHMFRTQGGDFGFPYEQRGRVVQVTKNKVKELFWNKKWDKAVRPLSWLIERFAPIPGWTDQDLLNLKNANN